MTPLYPHRREIQDQRGRVLAAVRRYARRDLARALGWGRTEPAVAAATQGARSLVFFVDGGGDRQAVVQAFDRPKDGRRLAAALALASRHNAPTPRILHRGWRPIERIRYGGMTFLAMERAPGVTLDAQPASPRLISALARSIARLHAIESRHGAERGRLGRKDYATKLRGSFENRLRQFASRPSDIRPEEIEAIRAFFVSQLERFTAPSAFQLCHHHLAADDVLYDPGSDTATLIDCANLRFSRASRDLGRLRGIALLAPHEAWQSFLDAYFSHSPASRRAEYEREGPFFEAFTLLSDLRHAVLRAPGSGRVSLAESSRSSSLDRLRTLIAGTPT